MSILWEKDIDPTSVQIGQRVYSALYGGRAGVVFNIRGEQSPGSVKSLGGGAVVMGGRASFDVVFDDGTESLGIPESIVRGVQWRILPEVAGEPEITAMRGAAILKKNQDEDERREKAAAFRVAVDALRANPDYAHLKQTGKDQKLYGSTLAAANIRAELKRAFPGVKFSVRSDRFSGGDSVQVTWTDGPTSEAVKRIIGNYKAGSFDGMTDCYNYAEIPWTSVFGDAKYIQSQRKHSAEALAAAVARVKERLEEPDRLSILHGWVQTPNNHDQRLVGRALEGEE